MKYISILILLFSLYSCGDEIKEKDIAGFTIIGTAANKISEPDVYDSFDLLQREFDRYYDDVCNIYDELLKRNVVFYISYAEDFCYGEFYHEKMCIPEYGGLNYNGDTIYVKILHNYDCDNILKNSSFIHEILHSVEFFCLSITNKNKEEWHKTKYFFDDYYFDQSIENIVKNKMRCD